MKYNLKKLRHLGVVVAKGNSNRLRHKNQQLVAGKSLVEHAANTLKYSGMFERIVLSTDSPDIISAAYKLESIDETYLRPPEWVKDERVAAWSVPHIIRHLMLEQEVPTYDSVTIMCGNVLFIRPSWVRVALEILFNYRYLDDKISLVTMDSHHFPIAVCRINQFGDMTPLIYEFPHSGIMVDIDYEWDLALARQIGEQVEAGNITLPYEENVHEQMFSYVNHNHMRGLKHIDETKFV